MLRRHIGLHECLGLQHLLQICGRRNHLGILLKCSSSTNVLNVRFAQLCRGRWGWSRLSGLRD